MKSLILDDDFISSQILKNFLSQYGECETHDLGENALNSIKHSYKLGKPFELVTLDLEMPIMSGLEVLEKIREFESDNDIEEKDRIPILMITSHSGKDNIMPAFRSGCSGYIVKPIDPNEVKKSLQELGFET